MGIFSQSQEKLILTERHCQEDTPHLLMFQNNQEATLPESTPTPLPTA